MAAALKGRGDREITSFLISTRPATATQERLARAIGAILLAALRYRPRA
jgi:hypothetical protein